MTPPDRWREAAQEVLIALGGNEMLMRIDSGKMADILRRLFPAREEGWISVEERLPEPSSAVLFFTTNGCWESGYFRADDDEPVRWECERTGPQEERIDFFEGQVTHWMIPDPPESTESERQKEER